MKLEVRTGWYFYYYLHSRLHPHHLVRVMVRLFTFVKVITKLNDFMVTESGNKDSTYCQNCILQSKNKFQNKLAD